MTLPDLPTDILLVIATLVTGFSLASILSSWVDRYLPPVAIIAFLAGIGIFVFVHIGLPDGLSFYDIPDAFILVAARILN